jgi:hypothetical protein
MANNNIIKHGNMALGNAIRNRLNFEAQMGEQAAAWQQQPNFTTEALLGQGCRQRNYVADRARLVKGISSNQRFLVRNEDYPVVGTIGQARAVTESLYARGRHMPNVFPLTSVGGGVFEVYFGKDDPAAPFNANFPFSQGFVIDWGVAMLNFAPFDLHIQTESWVGENSQVVDRDVTLRVSEIIGASHYVPWASRITPAMSMAQAQLGEPLPQEDGVNVSAIRVINLPGNIEANFSATVTFMTAFTPTAATYAALISEYGNCVGESDMNTTGPNDGQF